MVIGIRGTIWAVDNMTGYPNKYKATDIGLEFDGAFVRFVQHKLVPIEGSDALQPAEILTFVPVANVQSIELA